MIGIPNSKAPATVPPIPADSICVPTSFPSPLEIIPPSVAPNAVVAATLNGVLTIPATPKPGAINGAASAANLPTVVAGCTFLSCVNASFSKGVA